MKRAEFKAHPAKGGWIRTTIAPINNKTEATFGPMDCVLFAGLVVMIAAIARILIAH